MPSSERKKPLSQVVRERLIEAMQTGRYRPGQRLPTIEELARTLGASKRIVQMAVEGLQEDQIVEGRPGRGLFVKSAFLLAGKSRSIGLVSAFGPAEFAAAGQYPGNVFRTFRNVLARQGYRVAHFHTKTPGDLTIEERLLRQAPAGIALLEVYDEHTILQIRRLMLPMVSLDFDAYQLGVPSVSHDNLWAGFLAARHLLEQGHRRIVALSPPRHLLSGQAPWHDPVEDQRIQGYRIAMLNAGLPPLLVECPAAPAELRPRLLEVFGRRPAPTALVCKSGFQALRVAAALRELGFRIPQDASLIGFGSGGAAIGPGQPLTIVRLDHAGMGQSGARMLLDLLAGKGTSPLVRCVLPVRLANGRTVLSLTDGGRLPCRSGPRHASKEHARKGHTQ